MSAIQRLASLTTQYRLAVERYLALQDSGANQSRLKRQWDRVEALSLRIENLDI